MPFDEPGCVVALPKVEQRLPKLLDGVEGPHPEQVLLERADEALGAAISLRRPHEGGRACDAQKGKLLLEGVGHVLAPVIVPDGRTARDPLSKAAEAAPHALPDRLERLKAGGSARGMGGHALGRAMIDGHKPRDLSLTGYGRGQVGAPHRVYRRRDDGAVVVTRASGCPDPGGREQVVRAHEPQHATLGCAKACCQSPIEMSLLLPVRDVTTGLSNACLFFV